MSGKVAKMLRRAQQAAQQMQRPVMGSATAARFHPERDLVLCRYKPETVNPGGQIVLPENRAIAVPIGEVLATGPDCKTTKVGQLKLFALTAALALDGELFLIEESKLLETVDPASLVQPAVVVA